MADAYLTDQSLLAQNPEALDLSRQRKLADMLTSQMFNQPQGNMVSGYYVKPSWTQQLAPLASGIAGQAMNAKLDEKQLKLAEALRTKKDEVIGKINEAIDSGDFKAARLIATKNPEYAKDYIAPLLQNTLPKKTDLIINYEAAKADPVKPFKGSFDEWKNQLTEKDKADLALRQQEVGISGARLNLEQSKAAQELAMGKPLTEFQGKATNFGVQMAGSIKEMAAVEKSGFNPATTKNQALLSLPNSKLGNMFASPEVQRYKQGMDNFTENFIRFKSGANVPMHEIEKDLKNMMPQVGDSADQLNQKQRARERALQGMSISAGPGVKYIMEAYKTEAPAMLNQTSTVAAPSQQSATPSLWGKATVVSQ